MSYKERIEEGDDLIIWKKAKPVMYTVTAYAKKTGDHREFICGDFRNKKHYTEIITRKRVIRKVSIEMDPQYYL